MRKDITVTAQARQTRGKNEARRLRVEKLSPAIVYGAGKDPVAIAVSPKDLQKILNSPSGHNTVFNLDIQGVENTPAMIVDCQLDPVRSHLLHADLKRIDLTKRLAVKVGVHLTGEARGVKLQGGTLEIVNREIEIECLPEEIPEHFTFEISQLMLGQSVRASEIPLAGSMQLLSPADQVVVHVVGHKPEEEKAAEVEKTAEPEVIKKGKKEIEAEAAAEKKKK